MSYSENKIDYTRLAIGTISVTPSVVYREKSSYVGGKEYRNKFAYIGCSPLVDIHDYIWEKCSFNYPSSGNKLYVSPNCKVSRDIYRNSGYKIVRDEESADYVVIPAVPNKINSLLYNISALDNSDCITFYTVYLTSTNSSIDATHSNQDKYLTTIKDYFTARGYRVLDDDLLQKKVYFIPKSLNYEEILFGIKQRKYVTENRVSFTPATNISIETLDIWKNVKDTNLLCQLICQSDWSEYPLTLYSFLYYNNLSLHTANRNTQYILDSINYDSYVKPSRAFIGKKVTSRDWNFLQEYIMHTLGVGKDGGYIDVENSRKDGVAGLCRRKMAVKPIYIEQDMDFRNLLSLLEN